MIQKLDKYGNSSIDNANVVILDKNGKVKNLNYTGGTVTSIITASPITGGPITTTGTIGITQATTSTDGYLSSTDWNTFNGKFNLPTLTAGSVLFSNGTTIAQDNAQFFWDDTNNRLGIGTTTPGSKLDVNGDIGYLAQSAIYPRQKSVASDWYLGKFNGGSLINNALGTSGDNAFQIGYYGGGTFAPNIKLSAGGNNISYINSGNVGIGKTNPGVKLDVTGDIRTNGILFGTTAQINNIQTNGANLLIKGVSATLVTVDQTSGNVGIGTTAPTAKLTIKAPGALSTDIALRVRNSADSADLLSVAGTGNIIANGQLTISGAINGGQYYPNTSTQINTIYGGRPDAAASGIAFNTITPAQTIMLINYLGNVLIGTTTNIASSKLTVSSTTQGFLPPRMTNAQRIAIATPAVGLCVYCTDVVEGLYINKSTGWTYIG
jgi:hypothetical protein